MKLRIGDKVIVASEGKRNKPQEATANTRGRIEDWKWNMARVHFENGSMEWVELTRVYKAVE